MSTMELSNTSLARLEVSLVLTGFTLALIIANYTHYVDIVKNHLYGYPNEYIPSVSATIGDHYPARNVLHIAMALASFPRFTLLMRKYKMQECNTATTILEFAKNLSIGLFVYVTSCDNGSVHSFGMVLYVLTTMASSAMKWQNRSTLQRLLSVSFVSNIAIMSRYLYQHRVSKVAGAYSYYSALEWLLIPLDILSDHLRTDVTLIDMQRWVTKTAETYEGVLFFSNMTGLPTSIWHFPLWKLGFTGYESVLLAYFAPMFVPMIKNGGESYVLKSILAILSGSCLLSNANTTPEAKLGLSTVAICASSITFYTRLKSKSLPQARSHFLQSLFFFLVVKYLNNGTMPMWVTSQRSIVSTVILRLLFVSYHLLHSMTMMRWYFLKKVTTLDENKEVDGKREEHGRKEDEPKVDRKTSPSSDLAKSIHIGICLFSLHTFCTGTETLPIRFRSTQFSSQTVELQELAILSSFLFPYERLQCLIIYSVYRLLTISTMMAVVSPALIFSIFLGSTVKMTEFVQSSWNNSKNIGVSISVYIGLLLVDIYTVAYAFVPGGTLFREKNDILTVACIAHAIYLNSQKRGYSFICDRSLDRLKGFIHWIPLSTLVFCAIVGSAKINVKSNQQRLVRFSDPNVMTTGIWTIHFGLENDMNFSNGNMTNLIRKLDLDVVGLLETDTMRNIGGNRNLVKEMADSLNYNYHYGSPPNDNTWGCSMMTKYPIVTATSHLLPSPNGELACAVTATLLVNKKKLVDVIISHNGQEEDFIDRIQQTSRISQLANESKNPLVFLGYLVTKPGPGNPIYEIMTEDAGLQDIYPKDKRRWCEYIFYRNIFPLAYARISHGRVTDTELQSAKFWVGGNATEIHLDAKNMYPDDLIGNEWNGHRYHIYKRPIYDPSSK